MKRLALLALAFVPLLPILPFWALRELMAGGVWLLDWGVSGRGWVQPFVAASDWIERKADRYV